MMAQETLPDRIFKNLIWKRIATKLLNFIATRKWFDSVANEM